MRPHVEYAAPVSDPHLQKEIDKLKKVQKFALQISYTWNEAILRLYVSECLQQSVTCNIFPDLLKVTILIIYSTEKGLG